MVRLRRSRSCRWVGLHQFNLIRPSVGGCSHGGLCSKNREHIHTLFGSAGERGTLQNRLKVRLQKNLKVKPNVSPMFQFSGYITTATKNHLFSADVQTVASSASVPSALYQDIIALRLVALYEVVYLLS